MKRLAAGTAYMRADDTTADADLNVTYGTTDQDGNYLSDGAATVATIDCDTVTMP